MKLSRVLLGLALLIQLVLVRPTNAQISPDINFEHAVVPGYPSNIQFFAAPLFASNDIGTLRLQGSVSVVKSEVFQADEGAEDVPAWLPQGGGTFEFDVHGNLAKIVGIESDAAEQPTPMIVTNEYEQVNGVERRTSQNVTLSLMGAEHAMKTTFTYDDNGRRTSVVGQGGEVHYAHDDEGNASSCTKKIAGEEQTYHFDKEGRLTIPAGDPSGSAIEWKSPTEFEMYVMKGDERYVQCRGSLDEHGALLNWSFRAIASDPPLVNARNEITYDEKGNWTEIVTYVEAQPGEEKPSRPILKYKRTITYR